MRNADSAVLNTCGGRARTAVNDLSGTELSEDVAATDTRPTGLFEVFSREEM